MKSKSLISKTDKIFIAGHKGWLGIYIEIDLKVLTIKTY